ncbi:hypothetical protein R84981_001585 [Carnimonas sp. R-84981]|uniref:ABC transporter permease n=1 Tax=Carnimonas bestiolae TaxID=3402172 RepID=UPI003EDC25F0
MVSLARKTLIHEWRRFLPVVLAVGFVGVLLTAQAALVLGIFQSTAIYVKASSAEIWAGHPGTQSVNLGSPVSPDAEVRLWAHPDVDKTEPYQWVDGDWNTRHSASGPQSIYLSGISVAPDALMFSKLLTPDMRARLGEIGSVIVDSADLDALGVKGVGDRGFINGHEVRVVATIPGLRGLGGLNVLSSIDTARMVGEINASEGATYYVAHLRPGSDLQQVREQLQHSGVGGAVQIWSADQFSRQSQNFWLLDTGAGMAILFMAIIVCLVGAIITNQSFASVVASSAREYATLNALGASRWSLARVVLEEACLIGLVGLILACIASAVLLLLAAAENVPVALTPFAACCCIALVIAMALYSSILALRSLQRTDPAILLR